MKRYQQCFRIIQKQNDREFEENNQHPNQLILVFT